MRSISLNAFLRPAAERKRGGNTIDQEEGKCAAFLNVRCAKYTIDRMARLRSLPRAAVHKPPKYGG